MLIAVEARERQFAGSGGEFALLFARCHQFGTAQASGAAEHHQIDQRVGAKPVGAVDRHAGRLANGHEAGHDSVRVATLLGQHFAVIVRGDAAHVVMNRREDRDRFLGDIDACKDARAFGDAGQALVQDLRVEMVEVKIDVILLLADAAPVADFHGHGARHDIARGQILGRRCIALHEALAFRIGEITAFTARAFGDQATCAVDAGGVELHELHVLQRQARAKRHGVAIAGAGVRRGGRKIGPAIAACGKNGLAATEAMQRSIIHLERNHAEAAAIFAHHQIDGEVFDEKLGLRAQGLAIERVQDGMARTVGSGAGALGDALAVIRGHAAKWPLVDLASFGARERHTPVFKLIDSGRRIADEILDRILVTKPVGALDGVIHVKAPVILAHVAEGRRNAALCRHRVRAGGEHLRDAGRL